ncbi:MAG: HAD family phosphatase [Clostridia bacterium]|nr:HAD family phosphatase [Clostridia bacterium]
MYKFVAIDIDGTLLNSRGKLSARTKEAVRRVINNGVKVVLTSGRVTNSAKQIAEELNSDRYMICDNGASIYDRKEDKVIFEAHIDKTTVLQILDTCIENNIYYMIFTPKRIIVKDLKHMALAFYKQRHNCNDEATGINEIIYGGREYIAELDEPFTRIIVCDQDRPVYNSIVNKLKAYDAVDLMASPHVSNKKIIENEKEIFLSYSYAELLPKNTNKWIAIKMLIEKFSINASEVMAIGDNFNDIEMIKHAGLGVAMNNGSPVAKEVARVVAPSNDMDGVATVLEQYILLNNRY